MTFGIIFELCIQCPSKSDPRAILDGFWLQNASQSGLLIFPESSCKGSWCLLGLKMASRSPKSPPRRPKRLPKRPQDRLQRSQEPSKKAQEAAKKASWEQFSMILEPNLMDFCSVWEPNWSQNQQISINQSTNQSIKQSTNESTNQQINQSTNQPINQSTNQPINLSTNQPINQSTYQQLVLGKITLTAHFLNSGANWDIHTKLQPNWYRNGDFSQFSQID